MFTIVISEKGGAERREGFDKNEINVGRVQGNDLTLSKGNVSKHHARLLFRDSRFIVTDLKSTNGTYVNGRKISQATIVREGDKIYIGDFVLRLEATAPDLVADRESASRRDVSPARASVEPPPQAMPRRPRRRARSIKSVRLLCLCRRYRLGPLPRRRRLRPHPRKGRGAFASAPDHL